MPKCNCGRQIIIAGQTAAVSRIYKDIGEPTFVSRERTNVILIAIIRNVRKKSGPGSGKSTPSKTTDGSQVSPLGDHIIYDKKRRQPRPAKRWTDDLHELALYH